MFFRHKRRMCILCKNQRRLDKLDTLPATPSTGVKMCQNTSCEQRNPQDIRNFHPLRRGTQRAKQCKNCVRTRKRLMPNMNRICPKRCWIEFTNKCLRMFNTKPHPDCEKLLYNPCHYCGFIPDVHESRNGIDRVDSSIRGYGDINNLVTCCWRCNQMKGSMSLSAFFHQIVSIHQYKNLDDTHLVDTRNTSMLRGSNSAKNKGRMDPKDRLAFLEGKKCYLCGNVNHMSVDRVVNTLPYSVKTNWEACCITDNLMKLDTDLISFLSQIHRIWKHNSLPAYVILPTPHVDRGIHLYTTKPSERQCKDCPVDVLYPVSNRIGPYCVEHHNARIRERNRNKRIQEAIENPKINRCIVCSIEVIGNFIREDTVFCKEHKREHITTRARECARVRAANLRKKRIQDDIHKPKVDTCDKCSATVIRYRRRGVALCDIHRKERDNERRRNKTSKMQEQRNLEAPKVIHCDICSKEVTSPTRPGYTAFCDEHKKERLRKRNLEWGRKNAEKSLMKRRQKILEKCGVERCTTCSIVVTRDFRRGNPYCDAHKREAILQRQRDYYKAKAAKVRRVTV